VTEDATLEEAANRAISSGRTRLPLCAAEGGLDAAIGVLHVMDLLQLALAGEEKPLREIARPLPRVPDSALIDELLEDLQRDRQHMVLVVDEHGTTVGLVTLEDVLEEIVGEIEDEFDLHAGDVIARDGDSARVSGSASLRVVVDALGLDIGDPHEATIGGYVLEKLGRLPEVGEVIELDGHHAEVVGVADGRITELCFVPSANGAAPE
jgi:CBS domain containing-hemolysin-like protein